MKVFWAENAKFLIKMDKINNQNNRYWFPNSSGIAMPAGIWKPRVF
jgi:hypothetical protein